MKAAHTHTLTVGKIINLEGSGRRGGGENAKAEDFKHKSIF